MKAAMHCLFRYCCDADSDDDSEDDERDLHHHPEQHHQRRRQRNTRRSRRTSSSRRRRRRNNSNPRTTSIRHAVGPARMSGRDVYQATEIEEVTFHDEPRNDHDLHNSTTTASLGTATTTVTSHNDNNNSNDTDETDNVCCHPPPENSSNAHNNHPNNGHHPLGGIHHFLRQTLRWPGSYNVISDTDQDPNDHDDDNNSKPHQRQPQRRYVSNYGSPLSTASRFGYDSERSMCPTISNDQVVLPGSELQKQMALAMQNGLLLQQQQQDHPNGQYLKDDDEYHDDAKPPAAALDNVNTTSTTTTTTLLHHNNNNPNHVQVEEEEEECVICMEGFDETNPRMPTLCGCGENKTLFHLPCLYQWVEGQQQSSSTALSHGTEPPQRRTCPTCRETLTWEEF
mmetsp:Transcript_11082/g.24702  ORF Transcript_11082/g.24702 Transcript_11082/m.24702 type:complete len:397 (+) Transcript_11082:53-1243(+)